MGEEREIVGCRQREIVVCRESEIVGCREREIVGCREREIVGCRESEIVGCREREIVRYWGILNDHFVIFQGQIKGTLKKTPGISDLFRKGGGSRPIRNPYFDLVSEDPMLTGSPNQANEQIFRWFRKCFSNENSRIKQKNVFCISK